MDHFEELNSLDPTGGTKVPRQTDVPTPHKVAVLMLVQQFLKAKAAAAETGIIYPTQARRNFCMLLLKLIQYPDMSYSDLHYLLTSARYKIDTLHLEGFEQAMSDIFSLGIEVLFDFVELQNIEKLLSESLGVSQFSIVGLYIRRVGVVLERLSFPEMMALHKNICLYYEKGIRILAIGPRTPMPPIFFHSPDSPNYNPKLDDTECSFECSLLDTETVHQDRNLHSKWSPKQADLFVMQQINLLEKNELRALPPIDLQTKVNEIIRDNPLSSQAYFLAYMNQLRLRDYFGAREALHRAFDRCPNQMMRNYDHKGFQYFDMNLAVLHAAFNHRREAFSALKECIMLAQEDGDKRCLDLANSWHCLLNSNRIDPFEKSLPDIQDPGLIQSLSLAIQFVVKFGAQCGYLPLDLFELLQKSDELNNKDLVLEHISDSLALRSALWCLYGRNEMSSLHTQLLLDLRKTWTFGDVGNSESVSKVLSSLALWFSIQGQQENSLVVLNHARERFPRYPNAANWMISACIISIQQSSYSCCWEDANRACCQLYLLDQNLGNLYRAGIFISRGYFQMARQLLTSLQERSHLDMITQVRVLVLMAHTGIGEDNISAETLELLIRAGTLAASGYMEYEHAVADMTLAHVLLLMRLPHKALQAAKNAMEKIYINGGVYECAKMDFIFARCLVAVGKNIYDQRQRLADIVPTLERAEASFKSLRAHAKVLDVYAYMAKMYHELGELHERNTYARKFRQYYKDFPTASNYLGILY